MEKVTANSNMSVAKQFPRVGGDFHFVQYKIGSSINGSFLLMASRKCSMLVLKWKQKGPVMAAVQISVIIGIRWMGKGRLAEYVCI